MCRSKLRDISDSLRRRLTPEQRNNWDWSGAESELRRAIGLNPNYALAHDQYGWVLIMCGKFEQAEAELDRALQIEPVSLLFLSDYAVLGFVQRRRQQAITRARKVVEMEPNYAAGHSLLGAYLIMSGRTEGITELEQARQLDDSPISQRP